MPDMNTSLFKAEAVSKEFSGVRVLNDITLEIQKGEIFGIIGENGAGEIDLCQNSERHLYTDIGTALPGRAAHRRAQSDYRQASRH